ncbi:MAG: site-specific integrase [Oscillospiraceae bacterium]|nr:site-specific integrase [Oscillospiraceae bacterium]
MSVKRRDNKNRVLRNGESQRPDGRYVYKYVDLLHKQRFLYSWKLEPKDKLPAGKKDDLSLREKIRQVEKDRLDGIDPDGAEMTVLELVKLYLSLKINVKPTTEAGYKTVLNILEKEPFAYLPISKVRHSVAKAFLVKLQKEDGRSYSSIQSIRGVLRPAFEQAVEDDYIRKNPFSFELAKVVINDSITREAVTREQMRTFLDFVKADKHYCKYYDAMYILFHTGLRISEFVGLTVSDLDMKERTIRVDHQLQRKSDGTKYVETTKTEAGTRTLPMEEDVYACFQRILANRKPPAVEPVIDGYSGFLFFDKDERPMVAMHWEKYFQHAVEKYNKIYKKELPKITPHICRHTYCTNKAKSGMNPKTLQYLMGHSDISVTMNTYTHLGLQDAWEELQRLQLEYSQRELGLKKGAPALKLVKTA